MSELVNENHVADIRFNRPEKYNALSFDMIDAIANAINRLDKELIFTGKVIQGEEAARLKLVTHICEKPYEEAMALAREIASKNPDAIRAAKKLINEVWHGDSASGLLMESELMMTLMGSPNQLEAVTATFTKRPPKFKDPA